jgi:LPXTG-motif cell wall-anchored protein
MDGVYTVTIPNATITVQPFAGCLDAKPGDPSQTNETCVAGANVGGSITVGMETGLVYSIDGPGTAHDLSPVVTATTAGLPAGSYSVIVAAAPGYALSGASAWPLTIKIISAVCGQLPTHPLVTPTAHMTDLTCTAVGSYTLDSNAGVVWTVGGVAASAGTYQVSTASTVVVTATPLSPGYGFDAGIPNPSSWTFTFTKPALASCGTQLVTLAYTGVSSSLQVILAGGLVLIGIGGLLFARRYYRRA